MARTDANGTSTGALTRRAFCKTGAAACALLACGVPAGCSPAESSLASTGNVSATDTDALTETAFLFDTVITLTAHCSEEVMREALERCRFFEERFSRTREGSDIWNINEAGGAPVEVAPETAEAIQAGINYGQASGGLFDITIGAVSELWDFKEGIRPADAAVVEAVQHIDYNGVHVDGTTVQLADPHAVLDLGGLAKGFIADDLARLFRERGCESALINLGGNVMVVGTKPDGSDWRVGIQDPNAPTDAGVIAVRESADASVVTSGLYERCFEEDGVRYHHILDPRTGYPAETDLISSSVVSASSLEGDTLATWMFLLGHDDALAFLEAYGNVEGLLMDETGAISMTTNARFEVR